MIERLGAQMAAAANPAKAAGMQAYMKSTMPYHGVNLPAVRSISRKAFDRSAMSCAEWRATILELWRSARYREERYAALFLLGLKRRRACLTPKQMPMLEELIVTGRLVGRYARDLEARLSGLSRREALKNIG